MKNRKSKLAESLKRLKEMGWTVKLRPDGKYETWMGAANPTYVDYHIRTTRELIKLAEGYSSNNKQTTAIKACLEAESKCERAFVRDCINKIADPEEADVNFPKKKFADLWNWD